MSARVKPDTDLIETNGSKKSRKHGRHPIDWDDPVPAVEMLFAPYLFVAHRTWVWGPTESGKSLWVQWVCARLSNEGKRIVYVQQENSLPVEMLRWKRLGANLDLVKVFHDQGFELTDPDDVHELVRKARKESADLVVLDSLTSCWSGNEDSNVEIARFDRDVLMHLKDNVGAATIVIHHVGHASPGRRRQASGMGRGASAQGQKADTILDIRSDLRFDQGTFSIVHGKSRPTGGVKEPDRRMRIVDRDPDGRVVKLRRTEDGRSWTLNGKKVRIEDYPLDVILDDRSFQGRLTRKQEEARVVVREYLKDRGPKGATESRIEEQTDISTNTLYKVLKAMLADGEMAPHAKRAPYVLAEYAEEGDND